MRERVVAMGSVLLILGIQVAVVAAHGTRTEFYVAALSAMLAYISAINVWLWGRCRSWPVVEAIFELPEDLTDPPHQLQIVYSFADEVFSRPAQVDGSIGDSLALRVNPSDPSCSSLDLPRPNAWLAALVLSSIVLLWAIFHSAG